MWELVGGSGADSLGGRADSDWVYGGASNDGVTGGAGSKLDNGILGNEVDNTKSGNSGDGRDIFNAGNDCHLYRADLVAIAVWVILVLKMANKNRFFNTVFALLTTGKDDFATIAFFNDVAKMNHWSKCLSTSNCGFWA